MLANWFASGGAQWLLTVGGIIIVDIALSGDNALVIGAAASQLARRQRVIALFWGGLGAIVIRIALTGIATELLLIPLAASGWRRGDSLYRHPHAPPRESRRRRWAARV